MQKPPRLSARTRASVRITDACADRVTACDGSGAEQVYLRSAVGWRRRTHPLREDGELVTDPALNAMLDAAATPDR